VSRENDHRVSPLDVVGDAQGKGIADLSRLRRDQRRELQANESATGQYGVRFYGWRIGAGALRRNGILAGGAATAGEALAAEETSRLEAGACSLSGGALGIPTTTDCCGQV